MSRTAYQIVQESRENLVKKVISNMEKGYIFSEKQWDREALSPQNPLSNVKYKGSNRLRLAFEAVEKGYKDPRWVTFNQAKENNIKLKKDEHATLCEKWIWTKEVEKENENGEKIRETVDLDRPIVSYFLVFNAEQFENFPELKRGATINSENEIIKMADDFKESSECPIFEVAQDRAYYSPLEDKIVLPLRSYFKDEESFLGVMIHEMAHSTGNEKRLNRPILNVFGTEEYAKEELRAELTSVFMEAELGVSHEVRQDHTNYFISWIKALKDNPSELFYASNDSSKIADRLMENYQKVREKNQVETVVAENTDCSDEVKKIIEEYQLPQELQDKYSKYFSQIDDYHTSLSDAKKVIENIDKIENVRSRIKVFVVWSESGDFKDESCLGFKEADSKFYTADISREIENETDNYGYDKTKIIVFFYGDDGKVEDVITDRYDIGDTYQRGLTDFIEKNYTSVEGKESFVKKVAENSLYEDTYKLKKDLINEEDIEKPSSALYRENLSNYDNSKAKCEGLHIPTEKQENIENQAIGDLKKDLKQEIEIEEITTIKTEVAEA